MYQHRADSRSGYRDRSNSHGAFAAAEEQSLSTFSKIAIPAICLGLVLLASGAFV